MKRSGKWIVPNEPAHWRRAGSPTEAAPEPHEIVFRFSDLRPVRIRAFASRAIAEEAARHMVGKVIVADQSTVSTVSATSVMIIPDGEGPDGAEVLVLPKE